MISQDIRHLAKEADTLLREGQMRPGTWGIFMLNLASLADRVEAMEQHGVPSVTTVGGVKVFRPAGIRPPANLNTPPDAAA